MAHDGVQTLGDRVELHHARAQQITLQLTGLAALGDQVVFRAFGSALQIALHRAHVVHGFGHHARELLHAGEAVELQRVEAGIGVLGLRHARLHLRFGLHFHIDRRADVGQAHIETRASNQHFARLVDQAVEQLRAHAHRLAGSHTHRRHAQHERLVVHAGRRSLFRFRGGGNFFAFFLRYRRAGHHFGHHRTHVGCSGCRLRQRTFGQHLVATLLQANKLGLQAVVAAQQGFNILRGQVFGADVFDLGLHAVGHFAQAHGARQARTALERVQVAQHLATRRQVVRVARPFAQRRAQLGQQLLRFFFEDQEQVGVDDIDHFGHVVGRMRRRWQLRRRLQRRQAGIGRLVQLQVLQFADRRIGRLVRRMQRGVDLQMRDRLQVVQHDLVGRLDKAGCHLVQQLADFRARGLEGVEPGHFGLRSVLHMGQCMLGRTRQLGQRAKAHGGRAACQRMCIGNGVVGEGLVRVFAPLQQHLLQAVRPVFGLGQVDIEQRRVDAQRIRRCFAL